jgi:hypothetical protein
MIKKNFFFFFPPKKKKKINKFLIASIIKFGFKKKILINK